MNTGMKINDIILPIIYILSFWLLSRLSDSNCWLAQEVSQPTSYEMDGSRPDNSESPLLVERDDTPTISNRLSCGFWHYIKNERKKALDLTLLSCFLMRVNLIVPLKRELDAGSSPA
jgi:hypothetical protein